MKRTILFAVVIVAAAGIIAGCTQTAPDQTTGKGLDPKLSDEAKAKYLLASEPAAAKGVIDMKNTAKDGEDIVVIGRIGGDKAPFTQGRASFLIADTSFIACNEKEEPDNSDTPWDFC